MRWSAGWPNSCTCPNTVATRVDVLFFLFFAFFSLHTLIPFFITYFEASRFTLLIHEPDSVFCSDGVDI